MLRLDTFKFKSEDSMSFDIIFDSMETISNVQT